MQSALLDKINEISREIKPSSTYKAKPIQQSNEWINREVLIYEATTFYHNEITHVRSIYYPKKTKQHFKSFYFIYDKIRIIK